MWCGPAPLRPFNGGDPRTPNQGAGNRGIHPRGFRNYLDYANGTLGDWGIHWLDQVLWVTGEKYPKKIYSAGGRPIAGKAISTATEQTTDAPDHQLATFSFDTFDVQWEHRRFANNNTDKGENVGCYFYGPKGISTWAGRRAGRFILPTRSSQSCRKSRSSTRPIRKTSRSCSPIS